VTTGYVNTPARRALAFARNTWRGLTSMRTALILLFLLALAALPGAMLPQYSLNTPKVDAYIAEHGWWGELLDALGFFEVYSSAWFSAIYLLLMVSIVGCLLPRFLEYYRALRAEPVLTPRNLSRLPHFRTATVDGTPEEVLARAKQRLRGWRMVERTEDGGASISAERGYLREAGNLLFHFSMLGLIVCVALGKLYGYEGQVIVHAGGGPESEFCNAGIYAYDSFEPGLRVDGTELTSFCIRVTDFTPTFLPNGQPSSFRAQVQYSAGEDLEAGRWKTHQLEVNNPLRTEGDRVYLLGHGFAPEFTVTFPDGTKRVQATQWRPADQTTFLSDGATKFDPPGITDSRERRTKQLAITGLFAPTAAFQGKVLTSAGPQLLDPAVAVDILRGDLGLESGRAQSIFSIDQDMIEQKRLKRVARENLRPGESVVLDDGTKVEFTGVKRWVSLQVSHDPAQEGVLGFAVATMIGLLMSLLIKRRRVWIRVTPASDETSGTRTVVQVGGLAKTDQAGYGEEFGAIADELLRTKEQAR
jgi:cytochrome c biogenesis protein